MKKKIYVYYYHAFWQMKDGSLAHNDGIAGLSKLILDFDGYSELKNEIKRHMVPQPPTSAYVVIDSLSFLGVK